MKTRAVTRRLFLERSASLGALSGLGLSGLAASGAALSGLATGCGDDEPGGAGGAGGGTPEEESKLFAHGVASGDPLADAVILWTRITQEGVEAIDGEWQLASDPALDDVVQSGTFSTDATRDFTVKVDATGLSAGTTYYYRFAVGAERSAVGRTRTAPTGAVEHLRIGLLSCASLAHGYFHVYGAIAEQADLDVVVHLGDYIYEYADGAYGSVRTYDPPHEIVSLEDYRRRYAHYRLDAHLKNAHRQHAFVTVWDDHEIANNAATEGAPEHDEATQGAWQDRKEAAAQAYAEWMPIRDDGDPLSIWRSFRYGDLVDLVMLDTRLWSRTTQATDKDDPSVLDDERTLLGADQEAWLGEQLRGSTATWRLVAQQVMLGKLPQFFNVDQWDGYPAARQRFFDIVESEGVGDVVVLTGDIHSSWAMDLPRDPDGLDYDPATGAGSLAVEFVVPAVSSPGLGLQIGDGLEAENPWMKFVDTDRNGFVVLDVTRERVQAAYTLYDALSRQAEDPAEPALAVAMATYAGAPHVVDDGAPAAARDDAPALAP